MHLLCIMVYTGRMGNKGSVHEFLTKSKYNSHTNRLFRNLNALKINDIFNISCSRFYFKVQSNLTPLYFKQELPRNTDIHSHNTRNSQNLHTYNTTSELRKQLLNVKIPQCWNSLPQNLRNITNLKHIDIKLKVRGARNRGEFFHKLSVLRLQGF